MILGVVGGEFDTKHIIADGHHVSLLEVTMRMLHRSDFHGLLNHDTRN
jgi:hypothetical protein